MSRTGDTADATAGIRQRLGPVAFHCVVWSLVLVVLLPIVWPVMLSLNEVRPETFFDRGFRWWLDGVSFDAFLYTLFATDVPRYLWNSVLVATVTGVLSAGLAATAAYGYDRFDFVGRRAAIGALLLFPMVPPTIVAIPIYLLFLETPLFDTHVGLVVAYVAFTLPFTTWLLIPYVSQIPEWLEEAAMVDGSTRVGAFGRIFLPVAKPGLAAAFVLAWMLAYNEFLFAVLLIDTPARRTLPVGLTFEAVPPGVVSVVASIPMLVIFAILWWFFLRGEVRQYGK
ncbi:carbohydrate ABC transporter permease [Halobacteria archaeon HArc-gm2]|nr:carbohydrate ABC transporter permease [Halobacteria archaeon HArc-gm2]